jgi:hypothetical protein
MGYDEWKSTFLEMFCQPYSVLPLISGSTSKPIEDDFFSVTSIWLTVAISNQNLRGSFYK